MKRTFKPLLLLTIILILFAQCNGGTAISQVDSSYKFIELAAHKDFAEAKTMYAEKYLDSARAKFEFNEAGRLLKILGIPAKESAKVTIEEVQGFTKITVEYNLLDSKNKIARKDIREAKLQFIYSKNQYSNKILSFFVSAQYQSELEPVHR